MSLGTCEVETQRVLVPRERIESRGLFETPHSAFVSTPPQRDDLAPSYYPEEGNQILFISVYRLMLVPSAVAKLQGIASEC